eukprot:SAG31_NODE_1043_length_10184_cov_2.174517_7_plen_1477_part_00
MAPLFRQAVDNARKKNASTPPPLQAEIEAVKKVPDKMNFQGYSNLALEFGWVAMFGAAWPAAGLLAATSAALQLRLHAKSLCTLCQRPKQETCSGIGPWHWVFVVLACGAVACNCGLVFFTSNLFTTCKNCPTGWPPRVVETPGMLLKQRDGHEICAGHILPPVNGDYGSCIEDRNVSNLSIPVRIELDHDATCEFICDQGYTFVGEQPKCTDGILKADSGACEENVDCVGNWTVCQEDCADKQFYISVETSGSGARCEAANGTNATCWGGDGDCTGVCTTRGPPLYPRDTTCGDHGVCDADDLVCRCTDGYMGGTCGTPPGCSGLQPIEQAKTGDCPADGQLRHGQTCTMECEQGYMMLGDQPVCGSNVVGRLEWDLVCVPAACDGIAAPPNGRFGNAFLSVQSGSSIDSTLMGTCTDGGALPHGQTCEVKCDEGFTYAGDLPSCTYGTLTGTSICIPNVDCAGNWSQCSEDCTDKVYTVLVQTSGSGAACEVANGTTTICMAGDGNCTGFCLADGDSCGEHGICSARSIVGQGELLVCECEDGYSGGRCSSRLSTADGTAAIVSFVTGIHVPITFLVVEHCMLLAIFLLLGTAKAPRAVKQQVLACQGDYDAIAARSRWDRARFKMRQMETKVENERLEHEDQENDFPEVSQQIDVRKQYVTTEALSDHDLSFSYVLVFEDERDAASTPDEGVIPAKDNDGSFRQTWCGKLMCRRKRVVDRTSVHTLLQKQRERLLMQLQCLGLRLFKLRGRSGRCFVFVVADQELLETFAEASQIYVPLQVSNGREMTPAALSPGFTVHVPFAKSMKRMLQGSLDPSVICEDCRNPSAIVCKGARDDVVFKRRWCDRCGDKHDNAVDLFHFRSLTRARLTRDIIELRKKSGGVDLNLDQELARGNLKQYFLMHDQPALRELGRSWGADFTGPKGFLWPDNATVRRGEGGNFCRALQQPYGQINAYFGGEVALYSALVGHHLCWTMIAAGLGVVSAIVQAIVGTVDTAAFFVHAICIQIWVALLLATWTRQHKSCFEGWGLDHELRTHPRPSFCAQSNKYGQEVVREHLTTGLLEPYFSSLTRSRRLVCSCVLLLCFGALTATGLTYVLVHAKLRMDEDVPHWVFDLTAAFLLYLTNWLGSHLAMQLTSWENYRLDSAHVESRVYKTVLAQWLPSYFPLAFVVFAASSPQLRQIAGLADVAAKCGVTDHDVDSERQSCLDEFASSLLIILAVQILMRTWKSIRPFINKHNSGRRRGEGMPLQVEVEADRLPATDVLFDGCSSLSLQFGWVALFGAAWPLAAAFAAISLLVQMRVTANGFCNIYRRPLPRAHTCGMGAWCRVLVAIGVVAVCTNTGLMFFASSLFDSVTLSDSGRVVLFLFAEHCGWFVMALAFAYAAKMPVDSAEQLHARQHQLKLYLGKLRRIKNETKWQKLRARARSNISHEGDASNDDKQPFPYCESEHEIWAQHILPGRFGSKGDAVERP